MSFMTLHVCILAQELTVSLERHRTLKTNFKNRQNKNNNKPIRSKDQSTTPPMQNERHHNSPPNCQQATKNQHHHHQQQTSQQSHQTNHHHHHSQQTIINESNKVTTGPTKPPRTIHVTGRVPGFTHAVSVSAIEEVPLR